MTAFDYARSAATATRLIDRFGQAGAIRRFAPGSGPSYNPGAPTPTNHPARFVVTEFDTREIDGARILSTDKKVLVEPGVAVEPKSGDLLIEADGATLTVVDADPIKPAETVVAWQVRARR